MLSVAAVANNAREPKAVMAGCRLLWLFSVGQATESNSPTGEIRRFDILKSQISEELLVINLYIKN
ncbi:hypothetical protein ACJ67_11830 [Methylophilus sp. TWE2]|nr:hypothetical protein ACJ67_11830 [Methylophilus sp. TWE2]